MDPNVSTTVDTVKSLGGVYITFKGGSDLQITFQSGHPSLSVKAFKIGSFDLEDVPLNEPFFVPEYGTQFNEVTFALINKSENTDAVFSYTASGTANDQAIEIAYHDGQPEGYLSLTPGDTIAVVFDGLENTYIDSLRIAFRRPGSIQMGINKSTGSTRPTPLASPMLSPMTVDCPTEVSTVPYPDPYDNWVTVDLTSYGLNGSDDFAVWFLVGENPDAPAVMISTEPDEGIYHSFTYLHDHENVDWYVLTDGSGNIYKYVVFAYLRPENTVPVTPLPETVILYQNVPNPVNSSTEISYRIPKDEHVTLRIYDLLGRERMTLVDGEKLAGSYHIQFDAGGLPSGVYIYRLTVGTESRTKKMTILR